MSEPEFAELSWFSGLNNHVYQFNHGSTVEPMHACLFGIVDSVAEDDGFPKYKKPANEYTLDGNGNLTTNNNKGYKSMCNNAVFTRFQA